MRQKKASASGTTQFVWDGQSLLQEKDQAEGTRAQYSDDPGFWGGLVVFLRGSPQIESEAAWRKIRAAGGLPW